MVRAKETFSEGACLEKKRRKVKLSIPIRENMTHAFLDTKVKEMVEITDFLVGMSDMLTRIYAFEPNKNLREIRSKNNIINGIIDLHVGQKLYKVLYKWVEHLIQLIKSMNNVLDEFMGVFIFHKEKSDIILDLIKTKVSNIDKEMFSPLSRTICLNRFLDWIVADKDYSKDVTDHRFVKKAVNEIMDDANLDLLFSWYRAGISQEFKRSQNKGDEDLKSEENVVTWAVEFIDALSCGYNALSTGGVNTGETSLYKEHNEISRLQMIPKDIIEKELISNTVYAHEDTSLKWILYYKWSVRMQAIMDIDVHIKPFLGFSIPESPQYDAEGADKTILKILDMDNETRRLFLCLEFTTLHLPHMNSLMNSLPNGSEFVELIKTYHNRVLSVHSALNVYKVQ